MRRSASLRVLVSLLLALLLVAQPASAATGYEQVVDLTFPTAVGRYGDDYHNGRSGGRVHRATDVLVPMGTPVYAAVGGVVTWKPGRHATAGYALQVRGDDGHTYAYYHLGPNSGSASQAYAPGINKGTRVRRGQQIGYVGDSGNAAGTPHLHFEIHGSGVTDPYGSNRINPYPSLRAAERRGDVGGGGATGNTSRGGGRTPAVGGVLREGDRGDAVRQWQQALVAAGYRISVDGAFGPQTAQATRALQKAKGITVDGVVGPQTRGAAGSGGGSTAAPVSNVASGGLLRTGSRGDAVRAWQQALVGAGHRISVDGVFGPQTAAATRAFQKSKGITVDGVVGPQTRGAMG